MTARANQKRRSGIDRWAWCLLVAAALGARCGSVNGGDSRIAARDQAATATCMRYQACGAIGTQTGAAYQTLASCQTDWQANFEKQWPASACENKIDQANLQVCLSAIGGTSCTSLLDILNTLYVKCGQAPICGTADAGTGG
jgi:hypothetical protein